jgi:iron only hydrogenase large subunit-like protein
LEPAAAAAAAAAGGGGFKQAVPQANGALKVTLHDCLACSGCITSAETVLLQHQSTDELLQKLSAPGVRVVISLSPQSRASLAALHGLSPSQALHKLTAFLKGLGVAYVLDTTFSRDMSLLETACEFVQRYRARQQAAGEQAAGEQAAGEQAAGEQAAGEQAAGEQAAHSSAPNGAVSMDVDPPAQPAAGQDQQDQQQQAGPLPMLASACPGWVCYAEKTHGHYVLPYISSSKSPQAVMGSLVKRHLAARWSVQPSDIYHCR